MTKSHSFVSALFLLFLIAEKATAQLFFLPDGDTYYGALELDLLTDHQLNIGI